MNKESIVKDEHIIEALNKMNLGFQVTEEHIFDYDRNYARAIEDIILNSPEIKQMREDAEKYRQINYEQTIRKVGVLLGKGEK